MRAWSVAVAVAVVVLIAAGGGSAEAAFPGANGKIAYSSYTTGDIYAMNPDGTGVTQLTNRGGLLNGNVAWSPDGQRIAFAGETEERDFRSS